MTEKGKEANEISELSLSTQTLEKIIGKYRDAVYSAEWKCFFPEPGQAYSLGILLGQKQAYYEVLNDIGLGGFITDIEDEERLRVRANYEKQFSRLKGR